ncbi:MAG: SMC-Scp complex subunit ScpB [Ruminococcus sp.]|nr:SMC-Scp complex subunit ScpB [Ruminococcus sp.]
MTDNENLAAKLEAVLFAGGDPIEKLKLCAALMVSQEELENAADCLNEKYRKEDSGIELLRLEKSLQLAVKKEFSDSVKTALEIKKNMALSPAAMEVLTIVAYNQPVTKSFVEHVRGVDSSSVVNSLVEKDLLCEKGRLNLPGRPVAYATTDNFLRSFGLESIRDLPDLPEKKEQLSFDDMLADEEKE